MLETHKIRISETTGLSWQRWFTALKTYGDDRPSTRIHLVNPETIGDRYQKAMCTDEFLDTEHRSMFRGPKKRVLCKLCTRRIKPPSDEFDEKHDELRGYWGGW
jgi:hypothetical protein